MIAQVSHLRTRNSGMSWRAAVLELGTRGRTRLVRGLFAYLARQAHDPSSLPDAFYVRVGVVLAGRLPAHKILVSLLAQATSAPAVGDPGPPELALHLHLHERPDTPRAEDTRLPRESRLGTPEGQQ